MPKVRVLRKKTSPDLFGGGMHSLEAAESGIEERTGKPLTRGRCCCGWASAWYDGDQQADMAVAAVEEHRTWMNRYSNRKDV